MLAIAAAAFGGLILVSWRAGWWGRLALGPEWVPPAPGTATLLVLLGVALAWRGHRDAQGHLGPEPGVGILAAVAAILAAALALAGAQGTAMALEAWWLPSPGVRNGIPLGRTSLATASCFLALATALVVRERWPNPRGLHAANLLACAVHLATLLLLQGYLFGGPLFYGTRAIPVAVLTAAGLHGLAIAMLATGGVDRWPARLFGLGAAAPSRRDMVALLAIVALFVASSGAFWARGEQERAAQRTADVLASVTTLRAGEIGRWYEGFASSARTIGTFPGLPSDADTWFASPTGRAWLQRIRTESGFAAAAIVSASGDLVAENSRNGGAPLPRAPLPPVSDTVIPQPIHRRGDALTLGFWVPLQGTSSRLYLTVDVSEAWRSLLVPPDGVTQPVALALWEVGVGEARLLNDGSAGGRREPALMRSMPLDTARELVPGIARVQDQHGLHQGTGPDDDATGSIVRPVPGTPWRLAASTSLTATSGVIGGIAFRATLLSLIALLSIGALLAALWTRRELAAASRELELVVERERSVDELRRSEDRYARALRGTSDGLWDWDLRDGTVYLSPHWREMLGIAAEVPRTAQDAFYDRLHPDDVERASAALQAHIERGVPFSMELRLRHEDGSYRWFWDRGEVERDAAGRPTRMAGAITDISTRRLTEARLEEAKRLLRMRSSINLALVRAHTEDELYHFVCDVAVAVGGYRMVWIACAEHDADQRITIAAAGGSGVEYLSGIELTWADHGWGGGATGRAIRTGEPTAVQDLLLDEGFEPWREAARAHGFAASMAIPLRVGEAVFGALVLYADKANAFDPAEQALLTEIAGDISFGIGALRDRVAVDRQRGELALFRAAFERSNDAIFITDAATGQFVDFNAAACRWLQYTPEELRQLGPKDVVVQLAFGQGWPEAAAAIRHAGSVIWARTFRRKDGTDIPVEVGLTALDSDGRELILSIARDISDRDDLLARLARAERMESVGRLAGGVAHDFNNLLTVINTTADLAQRELPIDSPVREDLAEIRGAGARAAALTRQLLAFSRQQVMRREVLGLNTLVDGFSGMIRRVIGEDIRVETKLAPTVPPVMADRGQLEQVLMNLVVNARDAMPDGGALTIATDAVTVDQAATQQLDGIAPGQYAELSVTDTGVGMDRQTVAMIFEPFFTTKAAGKGTGLGLATVYGIVKQSGGGIWADSAPGRGTTFRVLLPATETAPATVDAPTESQLRGGAETILVVEDEAAIRQVVQRVLTGLGYTVLEAPGGVEALRLLEAHDGPLDLVLTDIVMPGMTGTALAAVLHELHPELKILFTSGYSPEAIHGTEILDEDANFISKPYTVMELAQEIRRVLDS